MRIAVASFGTRGDIEPSVAVARELQRRGHEVRVAVPPNLVGFVESTGLATVAYGLDTREGLDANREFWTLLFHNFWKIQDAEQVRGAEFGSPYAELWAQMSTALMSLADGADLLLTGLSFEQELAANVAEYYDIPLATLHFVPDTAQRPTPAEPAVAVDALRR